MTEVADVILANDRSLEADPLCAPVPDVFYRVGHDRITQKDREREESLRMIRANGNGLTVPLGLD